MYKGFFIEILQFAAGMVGLGVIAFIIFGAMYETITRCTY